MVEIHEKLNQNFDFPLERFDDPSRILFFDIETSGLNVRNAIVYLIGAISFEDGEPVFHQWFSESFEEEFEVLSSFADFVKNFTTLIHFNGDRFDIPFIDEALKNYGMKPALFSKNSIDILKIVQKRKKFFELENCKQKTIECFLSIGREDECNGGELIPVYEEYTRTKSENLKRLLLLHNHDDVIGMLSLIPVLNYIEALNHPEEASFSDVFFSESGAVLSVTLEFPYRFPRHFVRRVSDIHFDFDGSVLLLQIPAFVGELKCFYNCPSNYYFLPKEDMAIHKKLAKFISPENRIGCTKENCYTKARGSFVLARSKSPSLVLKKNFYDERIYEKFESDEEFIPSYIKELFQSFLKRI